MKSLSLVLAIMAVIIPHSSTHATHFPLQTHGFEADDESSMRSSSSDDTCQQAPGLCPVRDYNPATASSSGDSLVNMHTADIYKPVMRSNAKPFASDCNLMSATELCPSCNGTMVSDTLGIAYNISCDAQLSSQSFYAIQQWLTPDGCLAQCDNFTWCEGATFYSPGNCELAKGGSVVLRNQPGFMAFLPVVHGSGGTVTISTQSSTTCSDSVVRTKTSLTTILNASKPSSRTNRTSHRMTITTSHLLTPTPPGFRTNITSVSVLPSASYSATRKSHSTMRPAITSSAFNPGGPIKNLTSATQTTAYAPTPPNITAVSCPAYNFEEVTDLSDGRHFEIICGAKLNGAIHRSVSACDFADCAAKCSGDCRGIIFGLSTNCELINSITDFEPSSGCTAGVHITEINTTKGDGTVVLTGQNKQPTKIAPTMKETSLIQA